MGTASSKVDTDEPLRLCKERRRFIKQAIESRYALSLAHTSYIQSLCNIGIALRRFAEAEASITSALSDDDLEKTLSQLSSSPSYTVEANSPLPSHNESQHSPPTIPTLSYMKSSSNSTVTVTLRPSNISFADEETIDFSIPPPPPDRDSSWDFFHPNENVEGSAEHNNGSDVNFDDARVGKKLNVEVVSDESLDQNVCLPTPSTGKASLEQSSWNMENDVDKREVSTEREDPSEFITHRAKDFLSSIKDIENCFFRASESGKEVSRLLETNKIKLGDSEVSGISSAFNCLEALRIICCVGQSTLVSFDSLIIQFSILFIEARQDLTKVITWNRSASLHSSSSRNPLAMSSKDDVSESESDFVEEFCMFAGSHSSSLDRLYAWERKLYDEVKVSQSIWKEYDRKCYQLRHQFAKDQSTHAMDKTRSVVKDLYSRIKVAIHAVDSISRRIEKMRDEELMPQLLELIQGLIKMWKEMLECHHAQYITISLSYHAATCTQIPLGPAQHQTLSQLHHEIDCFGSRFTDWINSHTLYIDSLNAWLQICILHPQVRSRHKRPFSPRRALAPPIFILCRDWLSGIKSLPSDELVESVESFISDLQCNVNRMVKVLKKKDKRWDSVDEERSVEERNENVACVRGGLTKVLDRMKRFSEASLKAYENIQRENVAAQKAYSGFTAQSPRLSWR